MILAVVVVVAAVVVALSRAAAARPGAYKAAPQPHDYLMTKQGVIRRLLFRRSRPGKLKDYATMPPEGERDTYSTLLASPSAVARSEGKHFHNEGACSAMGIVDNSDDGIGYSLVGQTLMKSACDGATFEGICSAVRSGGASCSLREDRISVPHQ